MKRAFGARPVHLAVLLAVLVAEVAGFRFLNFTGAPANSTLFVSPRPIRTGLVSIASATNSRSAQAAIAELGRIIGSCPKSEAVMAIRQFLNSRVDAPTRLGFHVKADGSLSEAPTLRILLLDMLGKLAPDQAAQVAEEILQSKTSPDEWAVSLAAYARANPTDEARAFLQEKAEEMALYPPWQQNPSTGFLEAFDVFVYTHDTDFVPDLSDMVAGKENPALAHAAFLALDRLVQSDPVDTMQTLMDEPGLLAGREATEAAYFARADVRDPAQQRLLAQYLLSPDRSLAELQAFAGVFPNENFLVSYNLLTAVAPVSNLEIVGRYEAAWQLVAQWQGDAQFQKISPQLAQMRSRLSRILNN